MAASSARSAARDVVSRVRERSAYAHETLDAVLRERKLSERDASFATRLAYGTVSARGTLDQAVARYLRPDVRLEPLVSDALAVSAYDILFMSTPARAAVNEGVELVRDVRPAASGLANAVLRKLAADAEAFPWGDPGADVDALARLHGHPEWLTSLWVRELGRQAAESVLAADNEPAPLYLAHLPFAGSFEEAMDVLTSDGAQPSEGPIPGSIVAGNASAAIRSSALKRRLVVVCDLAAQLTAHVAVTASPAALVEIGAGRGTKSLVMAGSLMLAGVEAKVVALDLHDAKLARLREAAEALNAHGITTCAVDGTDAAALARVVDNDTADVVLVDAPCSGLGTLRRHPDRRWRAKPEEIEALAGLGSTLLENASRLVRPGGCVVYSTCTIARRENADVVEGFCASTAGSDFTLDSLAGDVPSGWERFVGPEGWFQSLPEPGGPDGHFIARIRRAR